MSRRDKSLYRGKLNLKKTRQWGKPGINLEPDGKTICLILEGAYPYVAGGVSSWLQQMITRMKDFRFKILTIMASDDKELEIKHTFPDNIIEFRTNFLYS